MIATHAYHKGVKLKEEDVRTVIEAYIEVEEWPLGSKKEFNKLYAEEFGVSPVTIADIVHLKKTWKYLLKEYGLIKEKN